MSAFQSPCSSLPLQSYVCLFFPSIMFSTIVFVHASSSSPFLVPFIPSVLSLTSPPHISHPFSFLLQVQFTSMLCNLLDFPFLPPLPPFPLPLRLHFLRHYHFIFLPRHFVPPHVIFCSSICYLLLLPWFVVASLTGPVVKT